VRKLATLALLAIALALPARGQDRPPPAERPPERPPADNPLAAPIGPVETRHALDLPGGRLGYRAVAESLPVTDRRGEVTGRVFTVSYLADGDAEGGAGGGTRPVTFVFNGGPGAASAYLHLGGLGPRVLRTAPDGRLLPPPARLDDNPESWLAFTDLVFVDPVGTGFSRAAKGGEDAAKPFWSVGGDVRSLGEVLRLWLSRQGRWGAPVFLAGESYGGFRVARLARALSEGPGIGVAGVVMISPVVEFSTISPGRFDLLPWALSLPSMAASARALGRGEAAADPAAVERFALTEYLTGIAAMEPAGAGPSEEIVGRVARLTGLEPELVRRHRARVPIHVFADRAAGQAGVAVSLYDGALTGPDPTPGRPGGPDILLDATVAPFSSAYNEHVREALGVRTDVPFLLLDRRPSQEWDWEGSRSEAGALDELQEAMAVVPGLSVLVVHGRTDLVTPYMASRWVLDRLDLPEEVRARAALVVLEGGHMMYLRHDMRAELTRVARDFYGRRLGGS
jgi:carboxypeptidase C (cathepsin A)